MNKLVELAKEVLVQVELGKISGGFGYAKIDIPETSCLSVPHYYSKWFLQQKEVKCECCKNHLE